MPFGPPLSPSLGLSLLKAELVSTGVAAEISYFSLRFAALLGVESYLDLVVGFRPSDCLGEWLFSGALFDQPEADVEGYVTEVLRPNCVLGDFLEVPVTRQVVRRVLSARAEVDGFLSGCVEELALRRPRIVGFSSVFAQHVASLALARRIKERLPETFVVFGGANCEGIMGQETLRLFGSVDAVVLGEGDIVFPQLVRHVLAQGEPRALPGVYLRQDMAGGNRCSWTQNATSLRDLDALPYPDYDDFFQQHSNYGLEGSPVELVFETSRGCWWGERTRCLFCGYNGGRTRYRSKSARRAMDELQYLRKRYPGYDVRAVDTILDKGHFDDLLPKLAERSSGTTLFHSVKANLTKDQVRALRDAGITSIQPGIESLSTAVLRLMRKGVTAPENIQLLKWCKELEVEVSWNLLWGFPAEPPEEYDRTASLIPLLVHLAAPLTAQPMRLLRFSPAFEEADRLGLVDVKPARAYSFIYPFDADAVSNLAYLFTFRHRGRARTADRVGMLLEETRTWAQHEGEYDCFFTDDGETLDIWDERPTTSASLTSLRGDQRTLYLACDSVQTETRLQRLLTSKTDRPRSLRIVRDLLAPLVDLGLMMVENGKYLSLAIPVGEYVPCREALDRFEAHRLEARELARQHALSSRIALTEVRRDVKVGEQELARATAPLDSWRGGV